jgi:hypothetical protein
MSNLSLYPRLGCPGSGHSTVSAFGRLSPDQALPDRSLKLKSRKVHSNDPLRWQGSLGAVCFHHTALRMQGLPGPVQVQRYAPVTQDVHPSALARHRHIALVYRLSFQTGIVPIYQSQCDGLAEELAMYQSKCSLRQVVARHLPLYSSILPASLRVGHPLYNCECVNAWD